MCSRANKPLPPHTCRRAQWCVTASIAVGPRRPGARSSSLSSRLSAAQKPNPRPPRRSLRSIDLFGGFRRGGGGQVPAPHSHADRFRILAREPGGPFSVLVAGFPVRVLFSRRRPTGSRLPSSSILFFWPALGIWLENRGFVPT